MGRVKDTWLELEERLVEAQNRAREKWEEIDKIMADLNMLNDLIKEFPSDKLKALLEQNNVLLRDKNATLQAFLDEAKYCGNELEKWK